VTMSEPRGKNSRPMRPWITELLPELWLPTAMILGNRKSDFRPVTSWSWVSALWVEQARRATMLGWVVGVEYNYYSNKTNYFSAHKVI
jgi:hypothetical protein